MAPRHASPAGAHTNAVSSRNSASRDDWDSAPGSTTRVLSRKKGVTATVCCAAVPASAETPSFLQLPLGMKAAASGVAQDCVTGTGGTRPLSCEQPCALACDGAVRRRRAGEISLRGITIDEGRARAATGRCVRQCVRECDKPGGASAFVVPVVR